MNLRYFITISEDEFGSDEVFTSTRQGQQRQTHSLSVGEYSPGTVGVLQRCEPLHVRQLFPCSPSKLLNVPVLCELTRHDEVRPGSLMVRLRVRPAQMRVLAHLDGVQQSPDEKRRNRMP